MLLADRILFIDDDAIVIDKPAGLPVDTPRRGGDSVVSRAAELRCGKRSSPVPMHRLDQDTSGCLLFARNAAARADIQRSFETNNVQKFYLAVVDTDVEDEDGTIDLPLKKQSSKEAGWRMVHDPGGLPAVTKWTRIKRRGGRTLVRFEPVTGRTHQIRVHAREAFGAGIVGDPVYGGPGGPMLLHAIRISVARPDAWHFHIDATAPLPEPFAEWRPNPAEIEEDKKRLKTLLSYRSWDQDWEVLAGNADGPLYEEPLSAGYPLFGVLEQFLEESYYEKGALEPLVSHFGQRHIPQGADLQRFLEHLAGAGRADLMERVWSSMTRRSRAKYFAERDEQRKGIALKAFADAAEWLNRVGSDDAAKQMDQAADDLREGRFPELPPVSDLRKMDEPVFWELISRTRSHAETTEEQVAVLDELLRTFGAADIKRFASIYAKYMKQLYHWNAWALAYAARGGCSDDSFMEFRTWLILQGNPELVDLAIKDPAVAAKQVPKNPELPEGTLLPTIDDAHLARAKSTFEWPMINLEKPKGREWPEDQLDACFPELVRHYAA